MSARELEPKWRRFGLSSYFGPQTLVEGGGRASPYTLDPRSKFSEGVEALKFIHFCLTDPGWLSRMLREGKQVFSFADPAGVPRGPFRGWQGPLVLTVACQGVSAGGPLVPGSRPCVHTAPTSACCCRCAPRAPRIGARNGARIVPRWVPRGVRGFWRIRRFVRDLCKFRGPRGGRGFWRTPPLAHNFPQTRSRTPNTRPEPNR